MDQQNELVKQAGQFANSPLMDPEKNPEGIEQLTNAGNELSGAEEEGAEGAI